MTSPTIDTQPVFQTVTVPATATFTVAATTSGGDLTYQWQLNSGAGYADIAGATSASYTTPASAASHNGRLYKVIVSDDEGSTTSDAAVLNVNVAQAILTSRYGAIANTDVDDSEDVCIINVAGYKSLWLEFALTVANLSAFTVEYRVNGAGHWLPVAAASGDYTTPHHPVLKASGNLAAAASGSTHYVNLDVSGIHSVRIKAAGTNSALSGSYGLG